MKGLPTHLCLYVYRKRPDTDVSSKVVSMITVTLSIFLDFQILIIYQGKKEKSVETSRLFYSEESKMLHKYISHFVSNTLCK